jgi:uncharacterized RDD family membrane protein YckC
MSCPSCGASFAGGQERCPGCGASVAPAVEGALAPDPSARPRHEPLREIPGLKKKERTWKDEVRERMHDRKRRRGGPGDLPLFREAAEAGAALDAVAAADVESEGTPPLFERPARGPRRAERAKRGLDGSPADFGAGEPDLPLRPELAPPPADLPLSEVDVEPRAMGAAPRAPVGELHPGLEPSVSDAWTLGSEGTTDPRPVERPAYSGERAQAAAVDLFLLATLWAVVVYFASRAAHVGLLGLVPAWPYLLAYLAFLGLTYAGYFTGTTGQTLGKIATGLRVVDAGGRPPGYLRAFLRASLGSAGVLLAGAGLIPMFLDPARRALHDRLSKTRVVKG